MAITPAIPRYLPTGWRPPLPTQKWFVYDQETAIGAVELLRLQIRIPDPGRPPAPASVEAFSFEDLEVLVGDIVAAVQIFYGLGLFIRLKVNLANMPSQFTAAGFADHVLQASDAMHPLLHNIRDVRDGETLNYLAEFMFPTNLANQIQNFFAWGYVWDPPNAQNVAPPWHPMWGAPPCELSGRRGR